MTAHYDGRRCSPLFGDFKPRQFLAFDTEDDTKGKPLLTVFYDGTKAHVYKRLDAAVAFLYNISFEGNLILTAHNLEYDLCNLFKNRLTALDWTYFGGKLICARIRDTKITCWDSLNHSYHMSLDKLGEMIGFPKIKSTYGWTKGKKLTDRDIKYAVRDAKIEWQYMEGIQRLYSRIGARMKTTTPATALDYWRRCYLDEALPSVSEETRSFFREGYYGGRVEIFRMGKQKGRILYLDVNSLYPSVMVGKYPDIADLRNGGKYGAVDATVEVPDMYIPPLPHRSESGKLLFPVGRFRGVWTTNEIGYARTLGVRIRKIHKRIGSSFRVSPFKDYIVTCYAERLNAETDLERVMWKFLMNSLYGKFGTSGGVSKLVDPASASPEERVDGTYLGPLLLQELETDTPPYANVLWAAWTTAAARIVLHKALLKAEKYGDLIYCDTDSVVLRPRAKKAAPFSVGTSLGEWKVEYVCREFEAKLPKFYRFVTSEGERVKVKGVPPGSALDFFTTGHATFKRPMRLRESGRRKLSPNIWNISEKRLHSEYDKRTILSGGLTRPVVP